MSSLSTIPKGDSAWLLRKAVQRIMQQVSVLETNIGSSTTGNSSNTQVIFNDAGTLRGDAGLTYNAATDTLSAGSATITGDLTVDTSTLKVDSANDRVGIGIAAPAYRLHVQGTASLQLVLQSNDTNANAKEGTVNVRHYTNAEEPVSAVGGFTTSTANEVYLGGGFSAGNAATLLGFYTAANNTTTIGTERYRIASDGVATWSNVGGTSGTAMTLNSTGLLVGASASGNGEKFNALGTIVSSGQSIGGFAFNQGGFDYSTSTKNLRIFSGTSNATGSSMSFVVGTSTSFLTAMTLDASGNLLVGKSSAVATAVGIQFQPAGNSYHTLAASTNADTTLLVYSTGAAAYRFYVGMAGTVFATNTTISAISDARLKENVQDLDVGLDAILALKPRKFDWKEGKGKNIKGDRGFIAQEFETVFPNLIDEWADPAPEGEAPYKSVRQDLIPVLVKAIQELTARVQTLEAK